MTSPLQVDQRVFRSDGDTPDAAMAAVREQAQRAHPDTDLVLSVVGERDRDGLFLVVADYWVRPVVTE